jgi:hypothetical protein
MGAIVGAASEVVEAVVVIVAGAAGLDNCVRSVCTCCEMRCFSLSQSLGALVVMAARAPLTSELRRRAAV